MPVLSWVVSNVILASAAGAGGLVRAAAAARPAVAHILWVLVLVKLVTPPLVSVPLGQSPGPTACELGTCGCEHHAQTQTFVRDTLPWILLAAWSAGAGTTAWIAWRRWDRFRRLMAHASPAPPEWQSLAARLVVRTFDSVPAGDSGRAGPIAAPGHSGPAPAARAAAGGLAGSAQCLATGRPAAARAGSHQARRPPGADARVDGSRGLLVVARRRPDRPAVAHLRGSVLRRGRGGPVAGSAARLRPVAAGRDRFRRPAARAAVATGHRDERRR